MFLQAAVEQKDSEAARWEIGSAPREADSRLTVVRFKCFTFDPWPLVVVGSPPELGNWVPEEGLRMELEASVCRCREWSAALHCHVKRKIEAEPERMPLYVSAGAPIAITFPSIAADDPKLSAPVSAASSLASWFHEEPSCRQTTSPPGRCMRIRPWSSACREITG